MKTPDEIKKGLEYLSIKDIVRKLDMWKEGIAYDYAEDAAADALAYIQQLEGENEKLQRYCDAEVDRAAEAHYNMREVEASVPRWIPVEERMPEGDDNVLVIVNGECKTMTFEEAYMLASYYPGEGWIVEGYEEWENPVVTHWMPLPEQPEEER